MRVRSESEISKVAGVTVIVIGFDVVGVKPAERIRPVEFPPPAARAGSFLQRSVVAAFDRVIAFRGSGAASREDLNNAGHGVRSIERALRAAHDFHPAD